MMVKPLYQTCWLDKALVINTMTHAVINGEYNLGAANRAAEILNDHERRNGRLAVYTGVNRAEYEAAHGKVENLEYPR